MYTSAPGHIIDCIEHMQGVYTDTVVSYLHMSSFTYDAYQLHLKGIFIIGT